MTTLHDFAQTLLRRDAEDREAARREELARAEQHERDINHDHSRMRRDERDRRCKACTPNFCMCGQLTRNDIDPSRIRVDDKTPDETEHGYFTGV